MQGGEGAPPGSPFPSPFHVGEPPDSHHGNTPSVSIVIPILNEREILPRLLHNLASLAGESQLVFVDGGSEDGSREWLNSQGMRVLACARGRGEQLARGAEWATGDILWFLHADSEVPPETLACMRTAVAAGSVAGACRLRFSGQSNSARWMTWFYARMRRLGLTYGDSGIYVTRDAYLRAGGIPRWPLFEDLGLLRRLRKVGVKRLDCLEVTLTTSSRRFEGWRFPLVFAQWVTLQVLFWLGAPVTMLAAMYRWSNGRR
ncbi:MAG: TIGR04283 family arsenosugar biosynthesis glycosyltransferase [Bryobacterales bacterium]|jgi:rSAM/selenodomain-associated transferase 2|nr:TIGR04283 family arsenosugar biosynthesis glycosyltransferase [Bryobacterales bacterium]